MIQVQDLESLPSSAWIYRKIKVSSNDITRYPLAGINRSKFRANLSGSI